MDDLKRKRLEAAGWKIGTVNDFLELSPLEAEIIEMKLALSQKLKQFRKNQEITQTSLAKRMNSSQSRVAKLESGDPSVSIDLLIRGLLSVGATKTDIALAFCKDEENNLVTTGKC
ncbi:helix-turn-helix transcriptional regulator [Scytonema hofmannii FACHB-248]|uniref:Helix-turn-helix transcriptional regulator n=1 Tax=Scytonema hofmannii FACHB-248 TaxID=1842502 RepID=A0ABR8GXX1_9CYAN|nr:MULTISPECIES: helix-turn-helix transcriptional regulator [Nostocales]MBD2608385.1 helix-turn-helix transcriptional regulator [Scytonema hofmannii FACHB-248]